MASTPQLTPLPEGDDLDAGTEREVRGALARGDVTRAAAIVVEAWSPALVSTWQSMSRGDTELVERVRGQFHLDLVHGLGGFRWQCPLRAWVWIVGRNAMRRELKAVARSRARRAGLDAAGVPAAAARQVAERAHSQTRPWHRTTLRTWVEQARDALDPDDALLLVLRVDQGLAWRDIARVFESLPDAAADDPRLRAVSARLRKRFTRVVARLREAAVRDGLLEG